MGYIQWQICRIVGKLHYTISKKNIHNIWFRIAFFYCNIWFRIALPFISVKHF